jgi:hypothetical protein
LQTRAARHILDQDTEAVNAIRQLFQESIEQVSDWIYKLEEFCCWRPMEGRVEVGFL